jgi:hypothetical protein
MKFRPKNLRVIVLQAILVFMGALAFSFIAPGLAYAQEADEQLELEPLPEEVSAEFDQRLTEIALQNVDIQQLQGRVDSSVGLAAQVLEIRRERIWTSMFQNTLALAKDVADRRDDGREVSIYERLLVGQLADLTPEAIVAIQHMRSRVSFSTEEAPPEDFVLDDQKLFKQVSEVDELYGALFKQVSEVDELYGALIEYVEIAGRFELDASPARNFMTGSLTDTAANRSVFLELAINDVETLRASVATLPNNTDLADWLSAAEARVSMTASAMQEIITLMNALDLETRQYRQQVLTVTGEITTDVLDVGSWQTLSRSGPQPLSGW